jgi:hypothetical protein
MSFLRFAGTEVEELARRVEGSGERMRAVSQELAGTDAAQLGTAELASAGDDFAGSWEYGFGQLSKLTKGVSEFAEEAARTFQAVEEELVKGLRQAGERS